MPDHLLGIIPSHFAGGCGLYGRQRDTGDDVDRGRHVVDPENPRADTVLDVPGQVFEGEVAGADRIKPGLPEKPGNLGIEEYSAQVQAQSRREAQGRVGVVLHGAFHRPHDVVAEFRAEGGQQFIDRLEVVVERAASNSCG